MDERLKTLDGFFDENNRQVLEDFLNANFGPDKFPIYKGENVLLWKPSDGIINYRGVTFVKTKDNYGDTEIIEIHSDISNVKSVILHKDISIDTTTYFNKSTLFVEAIYDAMSELFPIGISTKVDMLPAKQLRLLSCLKDNLLENHFCYLTTQNSLMVYGHTIDIVPKNNGSINIEYDTYTKEIKIGLNFNQEPEKIIVDILKSNDFKSIIESLHLASYFQENSDLDPVDNRYFGRYLTLFKHQPIIVKQLKEKLTKNEIILLIETSYSKDVHLKNPPENIEDFVEIEEYKWIEGTGNRKTNYTYHVLKTVDFAVYFKEEGLIEVVRRGDEHPFKSI